VKVRPSHLSVASATFRNMSLWNEASDELSKAERDLGQGMSADHRLKVAEIKALLAIGQELSQIHHEGINPDYRS
jgi:hypothetical protein